MMGKKGAQYMKKTLIAMVVLGLILCGVSFAAETIKDGVRKEYYPNGKLETVKKL